MNYDPKNYWQNRLEKKFQLSGVGHQSFSESYNRWLYRAKIKTLKKAFRKHHINPANKSVCDIGCGTGFFIDFYQKCGASNITGLDITQVSVEKLKQKFPSCSFHQADISKSTALENIDPPFDIVNVFDVLYHIKEDAPFKQAIKNITSIVHNDGLLLITDMAGQNNLDVADHVRFRSLDTYRQTLLDNGFSLLATYPLYYLLNRPLFANTSNPSFRRFGQSLDNTLAPIYYAIDKLCVTTRRSNLNLIVTQKTH